ncbi:hypothetical protein [Paenibacillus xylanexedens]|uniref:hypothetical protein n=1 Tax=Paenibacillus xylanexedens TaxID=528191 RepID=UPI000F52AB5D|nr:hypothetical protein [Paenibacillus xylanexedens]RPK31781.1 hypothetical protein EDO6_02408 [Paenibacillus xylanexedens]
MPYIKRDELKNMLYYFFAQGCNAGYGIDVGETLWKQEEAAFKPIYEEYMVTLKERSRVDGVHN